MIKKSESDRLATDKLERIDRDKGNTVSETNRC